MDRKLCFIVGTIFIITSVFLYIIEMGVYYFSWVNQMIASYYIGSSLSNHQQLNLVIIIFIPALLLMSIIFYIIGYEKSNRGNSKVY